MPFLNKFIFDFCEPCHINHWPEYTKGHCQINKSFNITCLTRSSKLYALGTVVTLIWASFRAKIRCVEGSGFICWPKCCVVWNWKRFELFQFRTWNPCHRFKSIRIHTVFQRTIYWVFNLTLFVFYSVTKMLLGEIQVSIVLCKN